MKSQRYVQDTSAQETLHDLAAGVLIYTLHGRFILAIYNVHVCSFADQVSNNVVSLKNHCRM
jgi:hypothetical protein